MGYSSWGYRVRHDYAINTHGWFTILGKLQVFNKIIQLSYACLVQFSSVAHLCLTLCDLMACSMPGFPVHHQHPELPQNHVGNSIQPSHPLSSPSPAFNLSQHQGPFRWVTSSHQVAKVLEFQLQHQSLNEYSGLISFRMDWLDLLAVQGTLRNLLQHHS